MTWLRVSKLHIPPGYKAFDLTYPNEAQRLINFLLNNGLLYYQRIRIQGGLLSIGRFKTDSDWYNLEKIEKDNPDYKLRKQHLDQYNVRYENIYFGLENLYDPAVTGINIPDKNFQKVTLYNTNTTIGYLIESGKY